MARMDGVRVDRHAGATRKRRRRRVGIARPQQSRCSVVAFFNGEIIQLPSSRAASGAASSRTTLSIVHRDRIILAAYDQLGIDGVDRFDGMFAFAIWARQSDACGPFADRLGSSRYTTPSHMAGAV